MRGQQVKPFIPREGERLGIDQERGAQKGYESAKPQIRAPAAVGGTHPLNITACADGSTADYHADRAGLDVQRLDVMAEVEWAAHHGVGIHGQEHVADEEVERRAVDL